MASPIKRVRGVCLFVCLFANPCFVVERVSLEKDRLEEQKEQAEADLLEAIARLKRLRRQEKHLREKAAEMIRRGVEDLDELEAIERQEAEASALSEIQILEDHGVIDWSAMELDLSLSGGSPLVSSGHA